MDFLDNVMKSSNALIKERLNNPFGSKQQQDGDQPLAADTSSGGGGAASSTTTTDTTTTTTTNTTDHPSTSSSSTTNQQQQQQQASSSSGGGSGGDSGQTPSLGGENGDKNSQFAAIAADADAVAQKAVKGAKNIGNFLFSMANKAGQHVSQTAKQVKQVVESTNILTDFTREQQEFIKEHGGSMQAGELPWANCADEAKVADIREQVLSLSQDKRNFVRSPPKDANFQFDSQKSYPIALSLLKEDPNLGKMRFELVPKMVSEDTFWCNYFYRVSLLKQMSDRGEDIKRQGWTSSRSSSGEGPDEITAADEVNQGEISPGYATTTTTTTATSVSQAQQGFNQDTTTKSSSVGQEFESSESRRLAEEANDLKSKLKELNIGSLDDGGGQDENDKWEEELQRDLQEFELVSGDVSALDEEALVNDIMELKKSTNDTN